jgi:hypothetical protein
MPTIAGYAYKRVCCVKDYIMWIYQKRFLYFTEPNSFYPEKIIKSDSPNMASRASKGSGDKDDDKRREEVMREFVRQENVHSKTKEITGTLPYSLSMRPATVTTSEEVEDIVLECQTVNAPNVNRDNSVRVRVLYRRDDVVTIRHNLRRETSSYWLAILLEVVCVEADSGRFLRNNMSIRWLNQTEDSVMSKV